VTTLAVDMSESRFEQWVDRVAGGTDDRVLTDCHLNQGRIRGDVETT